MALRLRRAPPSVSPKMLAKSGEAEKTSLMTLPSEVRNLIWQLVVLSPHPVNIKVRPPSITRVSYQCRKETLDTFLSLNSFELVIDCESQLWIAQELQALFMTLSALGPTGCGKIRSLHIYLVINEVQEWMSTPTGCFIGVLGVIRTYPRTSTLGIGTITVTECGRASNTLQHEPPALAKQLMAAWSKAGAIGNHKKWMMGILAQHIESKSLAHRGWARGWWCAMVNIQGWRDMSTTLLLLSPIWTMLSDIIKYAMGFYPYDDPPECMATSTHVIPLLEVLLVVFMASRVFSVLLDEDRYIKRKRY